MASVRADCRKAFEASSQIVREKECTTAALHGAELTSADRLMQRRPPYARDVTGLENAVSKRCVHMSSPPIVREWFRRPRPRHLRTMVEGVTLPSGSGNRRKGWSLRTDEAGRKGSALSEASAFTAENGLNPSPQSAAFWRVPACFQVRATASPRRVISGPMEVLNLASNREAPLSPLPTLAGSLA